MFKTSDPTPARGLVSWIGVALIVFGGLNGTLAIPLTTCTQGSDDHILFAAIVATTFEVLGGVCLLLAGKRSRPPVGMLICSIAFLAQIGWAGVFTFRHIFNQVSACTFIGKGDFAQTGREWLIVMFWLTFPLLVMAAVRPGVGVRRPVAD